MISYLLCQVMELDWWVLLLLLFLDYKLIGRLIRILTIRRSERHVFITGCDSGFGNLLAKRLDKKGANVFAGCFSEKGETELRKACSSRLVTVPLDVTKHDSVLKAYDCVKGKLPVGQGLWGVVNNAGISGLTSPMEFAKLSDYQAAFDVNTFGMVDVATTFLPLVKKERGRVVNMVSAAGRLTLAGAGIYCMTKYGMEAFSDSLRRQMRMFKVGVHIIEPGFYRTAINNAKSHEISMTKAFREASKETQEEYGEECIKKFQKVMFEDMGTKLSDKLDEVVDAYEHALFGYFPRARYVVGWDATILIGLEYLPEWLSDWISEKMSGTSSVIPDALKK